MAMATAQLGTSMAIAEQAAISGYIVLSDSRENEVNEEEVEDAAGHVVNLTTYEKYATVNLELLAVSGSTFSEFVENTICTASGLTTYMVKKCAITHTKGASKASVTLKLYPNLTIS